MYFLYANIDLKDDFYLMILITRDEKQAVLERFPNVHIVRTMKQDSKRHRYYMVEEAGPMRLIRKMRGLPEEKPRNKQRSNRR